jgi:hypothetical protein
MWIVLALRRSGLIAGWLILACAACVWAGWSANAETSLCYFPSGAIYDYRWKLLELALAHADTGEGPVRLIPSPDDVTQNRAVLLLQSGAIDVIALGTNHEREQDLLPVKIDILRGLVGFRLLIIRAADQASIATMDDRSLRTRLTFGLNSQWADLPIMQANGFSVVTSPGYESLFHMLAAGRFSAFPRGLNEAWREIDEYKNTYPQLMIEQTKAFYFPYPVYFWVRKENVALAQRITRGLRMSLADGSFRRLFETYHAAEITAVEKDQRHVILLDNPILPAGTEMPDTSWWWPKTADRP